MRITNSMIVSGYLKSLNDNSNKMDKLQGQVTGKKLSKASDDPVAASQIMQYNSAINKISQYSDNVDDAKNILKQSETSLNEMSSLIQRVNELTVNGATDTTGQEGRDAIATEIDQITQQLVTDGNSTFNGKYIFGGENTTTPPFEVKNEGGQDVIYYNGQNLSTLTDAANSSTYDTLKSQRLNYQTGFGANMDVSFNGIDIFGAGSNNMFNVLSNLKTALKSGDSATIQSSITSVQNLQDNIAISLEDVGGKSNRLDFFSSRLDNDSSNLSDMKAKVEYVDTETATMNFSMQQSTYEAALAVGAKLLPQTLLDYIK